MNNINSLATQCVLYTGWAKKVKQLLRYSEHQNQKTSFTGRHFS